MKHKNPIFTASPHLISIDGPDGVGKTTFARILVVELERILGPEKVILVQPSFFNVCNKSQKIEKELEKAKTDIEEYSRYHNFFFLRAMRANYENVILPAIKIGKLVILDSSEIRSLAFIIDKGTEEAASDTIQNIENGFLNYCMLPQKRFIMSGSVHDLQKNLATKQKLDRGDPKNIAEINKRILAYKKSIRLIQKLYHNTNIDWIELNIRHVTSSLKDYFLNIIQTKVLRSTLYK